MRYFWALLAYVTAIVVGAASCGSSGKGNGFTNTGGVGSTGGSANTGGGGSSGVGITFTDAGMMNVDGAPCPAYRGDCKAQGLNCGMATDGCGNVLSCGTCTSPDTCNGGGTQNVCGHPPCVPDTCMSLGYNCGSAIDPKCQTMLSCGTCGSGQVCGANNNANVCGTGGVCTPKTCAQLMVTCGSVGDGCMSTLSCGSCAANQTCKNGSCVTVCTPKTCAQLGATCGAQSDGCGGIVMCGTCTGGQSCMGLACGNSVTCTNWCLKQQTCPGTATTSISGTVYAPQGTDPLPNTLVYVPNSAVMPFTPGVQCGSCGSDVSGSPLVSAVTDYAGNFTITNMPVGTNVPLVIQNGRWRRQFVIPTVTACVNTPIPSSGAQQLRMPRTHLEGDIPLMAFVTGSVDALECVLRKIGIADTEFSDPSGTGRVRFYQGDGSPGAVYSLNTPIEDSLWGSQATINQYDMVYFACQGAEYDKDPGSGYPNAQANVINYANMGGRVFATHYSYVWLFDDAWSATANWNVDQSPNFVNDPETGFIVTSFPKGLMLAQWLKVLYPATTQGQIPVQTLRHDFDSVINPPSQLWIYLNDPNYAGQVPMHMTFNTPITAAPANQCGRVLYDDFHVEDAFTAGLNFPTECTVPGMTPQEKMLEFMIFDLGSCVTPPVCVPKTCASQGAMCGQVGDGCGSNVLSCGSCPSGQSCIGGVCSSNGCTPKTCADQGYVCGMQGDSCGNSINCGTCPSGKTCGSGGVGMCGSGTCTPTTCTAQGVMCGSIGDNCGNLLNCGVCPTGEICGGGANPKPGICGKNTCVPKSCIQLGYNCGAASDGCGNIIQCGACSGTQTCGGSGSPNVCGGGV